MNLRELLNQFLADPELVRGYVALLAIAALAVIGAMTLADNSN